MLFCLLQTRHIGYSSNSSCQTVTSSHSSRSGLGQGAAPAPSTATVASQTSRHSASVTERHHAHAEAVGSCSTAALTGHPHGVMPALQGEIRASLLSGPILQFQNAR